MFRNFFAKWFRRQEMPEDEQIFRPNLGGSVEEFREFARNTVPVKIWIPRQMDELVEKLSDYFNESKPRYLRQMLFSYVYGRYKLECFKKLALEGADNPDEEFLLYSRGHRSGPNTTPELGKNGQDIKLWLPLKLRDDLQSLADRVNVPLSQFIREILVSELLGHAYLPERKALIEDDGPTEKITQSD